MADRERVAKRRRLVADLKRMGATYRDIAEEVTRIYSEEGRTDELPATWDERTAFKDLRAVLAEHKEHTRETLDEWRAVVLARYEEMTSRVYPLALGTEEIPPDLRAAAEMRLLLKELRGLLGLDAPARVEVRRIDPSELTDDELDALASGTIPPRLAAGGGA